MTESEISEEDIPDVPKWVLGIVLAVRMIGGLVIAAGALYVVSLFTQIPFLSSDRICHNYTRTSCMDRGCCCY